MAPGGNVDWMNRNPSLRGLTGPQVAAPSEVALAQVKSLPSIEARSGTKNKGGRPSSLVRLGILREDIWNLVAQGYSNAQIAKQFSRSKAKISVRTVATYRAEMPADYELRFDEFSKLPGSEALCNWIRSRYQRAKYAERYLSYIRAIWKACWLKPLESLDEDDIVKALLWVREYHRSNQISWILGIRFMIRAGIGQPAWLSKHLSTKGKKYPARSLAILGSPEFLETKLPRILTEVDKIENVCVDGSRIRPFSERMKDELRLVLMVKATTGIRTGALREKSEILERELWGTRLAAGRTSLQIIEGKLSDWIVHAKGNEIWHIKYMPPRVLQMLLSHISKYQIKQGEQLIQELEIRAAGAALRQTCTNLNLPPLRLHDLRKVYLTALCLSGVPLETAVELNVGWLDINTARKHYLQVKALNAESEYTKMSQRFFS